MAAGGGAIAFACSSDYEEATTSPSGPDASTTGTDAAGGDGGGDAAASGPTWLPREGVYRYRVDEGVQRLSVGSPEYRNEGPVAPAEIRYEAGSASCWRFRLCLVGGKCDDVPTSNAYSEVDWSFCVTAGRLEERGERETTRWVVLNDPKLAVSAVTCDPGQALFAPSDPSSVAGAPWSHVCQGSVDKTHDFATSGPYRYLGEETVTIGGAAIPAFHFREERTVTPTDNGAPMGMQVGEWWLAKDGLPLRVRRGVSIDTDIGFGTVEFRQLGTKPADAGEIPMDDCVLDSTEPGPLAIADAGDQ